MRLKFLIIFALAGAVYADPTIAMLRGNERLNVQFDGVDERLGSFLIVNPKCPTPPDFPAFSLQIRFINGCKLKRFGGGGEVPLSKVRVQRVGATVCNTGSFCKEWNISDGDCNVDFEIDFDDSQESYEMEILGSWDAKSFKVLAGSFWENAVFNIKNGACSSPAPKRKLWR